MLAVSITAFTLIGCEERSKNAPAASTPADNTGTNVRDRDGTTTTPTDQSETSSDVQITAAVRKAIVDDKSMSVNAQNCKVVVSGGVVTLRGPVANQAEKDAIEAKARATAGVTNVINELEIAP
jgi:osmotically-inducible protein OsmY